MTHKRRSTCKYCAGWLTYDRPSASYICPNCHNTNTINRKYLNAQHAKLTRLIFRIVKTTNIQDVEKLNRILGNHFHNSHDKPEPAIVPVEPPVTTDSIPFRRRRGKH